MGVSIPAHDLGETYLESERQAAKDARIVGTESPREDMRSVF